jgi:hypothetical protein
MIKAEERTRRINEIPIELKNLRQEHKSCVKKNWIIAASRLRKKIEALEREFSELYDSFGEERKGGYEDKEE